MLFIRTKKEIIDISELTYDEALELLKLQAFEEILDIGADDSEIQINNNTATAHGNVLAELIMQ